MSDTQKQPASVPAGLVVQWAHMQWTSGGFYIGPSIDSLQAIANKAAAYGREQSQQWVPVSERLPEDDLCVIYSSPHVGVWQGKYIADGCTFSSRGGFLHYSDVTHWMPLPEPPTC